MTLTQFTDGNTLTDDDLNAIVDHLQGASGSTEAWFFRSSTGNDFIIRLSDAAGARQVTIQDSAGVEVASIDSDGNLTISGTFTPTTQLIPTAASPSQTAEGSAVWDSDDDRLTIGTGSATKVIGLSRGAGSNASATQELMYDTTAAALKVWNGSASVTVKAGMTLLSSSDTPVQITATTLTDIVAITGLSIPVTSKVILEIGVSKDALAANDCRLNLTVNSTALGSLIVLSATQQVEDGFLRYELMPRTAAAANGVLITLFSRVTASGAAATATSITSSAAVLPVVAITDLTIRGINSTANNNLTVEWYRLWELPL